MSPACLESQGCVSLIPRLYIPSLVLLPSPAALSVLSFFCFCPILLTSFSLNLHFRKVGSFVWLLGFFEWLGDEYFIWWYVQHLLPYGIGISIYIVFVICNCFGHSFLYIVNLVLKRQRETVNATSIS